MVTSAQRVSLLVLVCFALSSPVASAGFYRRIDDDLPPNSRVWAINDKGDIAGWIAVEGNNEEIGFVRPYATGVVQQFRLYRNGSYYKTEVRGINNNGLVIGYAWAANSNCKTTDYSGCTGFILPHGASAPTVIRRYVSAALIGTGHAVNDSGTFVGDYDCKSYPDCKLFPSIVGYRGSTALFKYSSDLVFPIGTQTNTTLPKFPIRIRPRGINNKGDIVGFYTAEGPPEHGFLHKADGTVACIQANNKDNGTDIFSINDAGVLAGQWRDVNGNFHGIRIKFERGKSYSLVELNVPNAFSTELSQINSWGGIVAYAKFCTAKDKQGNCSNTSYGNYLYCPTGADKNWCQFPTGVAAAEPPAIWKNAIACDAP